MKSDDGEVRLLDFDDVLELADVAVVFADGGEVDGDGCLLESALI